VLQWADLLNNHTTIPQKLEHCSQKLEHCSQKLEHCSQKLEHCEQSALVLAMNETDRADQADHYMYDILVIILFVLIFV